MAVKIVRSAPWLAWNPFDYVPVSSRHTLDLASRVEGERGVFQRPRDRGVGSLSPYYFQYAQGHHEGYFSERG
jgi:hypothetical protein